MHIIIISNCPAPSSTFSLPFAPGPRKIRSLSDNKANPIGARRLPRGSLIEPAMKGARANSQSLAGFPGRGRELGASAKCRVAVFN